MPLTLFAPRLGQPALRRGFALLAANPLRLDPTRTTFIRRQFENAIAKRCRKLASAVRKFFSPSVDALALRPVTMAQPQYRQYEFLTDASKLEAFSLWLRQQIEEDILQTADVSGWRAPSGSIATGPWTGKYVHSAYRRGLINAFLEARSQAGSTDEAQTEFLRRAFAQPEMLAKVQLLATRSYEQLRGFSSEMATQLNFILAKAMAEGTGPVEIAKLMVEQIDGLVERRALRIARTEIIHAHAEGQLDAFADLGIDELGLKAEWVTAGDDRVCPRCGALEGKTFTVEEARGKIPLHPNCRCSWTMSEAKTRRRRT